MTFIETNDDRKYSNYDSYGPPHMAVQKQDDQHEHSFSSYVRIRDAVLKTYLGRWTIGRSGERGSGISVLPARYDDDDDDDTALMVICDILDQYTWESYEFTDSLGLDSLVLQPVYKKGNWTQTASNPLKIWLCVTFYSVALGKYNGEK